MRLDESKLFAALETALRAAPGAMSAPDLYEMPAVRDCAASSSRVSDYLGALWRKGKVVRVPFTPADPNSRARWAYEWKGNKGAKIHDHVNEFTPRVLADRPSVLITEEGKVMTLEFANLVIVIKQK